MIATRLHKGEDLKEGISSFLVPRQITSASIVSAVGSLSKIRLRMAGAKPDDQDIRTYEGTFEIVSIIGTIDKNGKSHLHMSFSDSKGNVIGGHVTNGCIVHTTVECTFVTDKNLIFSRRLDPETGFDELAIEEMV